jgi:hypothetical protein
MSVRPGAPYNDEIQDGGLTLIYEGHDEPKSASCPDPKNVDQPLDSYNGALTQNGKFFRAAIETRDNNISAEEVRVYEKLKKGIWVYSGIFKLVDAWVEQSGNRSVCKFKLEMCVEDLDGVDGEQVVDLDHVRLIPSSVRLEVWKRDQGKCVQCGSEDNLHYDHIIPFSKGGSSFVATNIQLLCARHNLSKGAKII